MKILKHYRNQKLNSDVYREYKSNYELADTGGCFTDDFITHLKIERPVSKYSRIVFTNKDKLSVVEHCFVFEDKTCDIVLTEL